MQKKTQNSFFYSTISGFFTGLFWAFLARGVSFFFRPKIDFWSIKESVDLFLFFQQKVPRFCIFAEMGDDIVPDAEWTIHGEEKGRAMVTEAVQILQEEGDLAQYNFLNRRINMLRLQAEFGNDDRERFASLVAHNMLIGLLLANPHYHDNSVE